METARKLKPIVIAWLGPAYRPDMTGSSNPDYFQDDEVDELVANLSTAIDSAPPSAFLAALRELVGLLGQARVSGGGTEDAPTDDLNLYFADDEAIMEAWTKARELLAKYDA